jgi:hypothetical protein
MQFVNQAADAFGNALASEIIKRATPVSTSESTSDDGVQDDAVERALAETAGNRDSNQPSRQQSRNVTDKSEVITGPVALTTGDHDQILDENGVELVEVTGIRRRPNFIDDYVVMPAADLVNTTFNKPVRASGTLTGWGIDGVSTMMAAVASMPGSPYDPRGADLTRGALVGQSVSEGLYGLLPQEGDFYAGATDDYQKRALDAASFGMGLLGALKQGGKLGVKNAIGDGVGTNSVDDLLIGASRKDGQSLFNPLGGKDNCVNSVCAFLNTIETKKLHTAGINVAENRGSVPAVLNQIEELTGVTIGRRVSAQFSTLNTKRDRQFFIVFQGPDFEVSNHVAVGIVNKGNKTIFDPQTGQTFKNLSDWNTAGSGSFTAFPLIFKQSVRPQ